MSFRYEFDKSSKKYICPKCNKKKLVCFYDSETKEQMPLVFGVCERKNSCGYVSYPEFKDNSKNTNTFVYKPPKQTSFLEYNLVSKCLKNYSNNNFIQFLKSLFNDDQVNDVISKYHIGTSKYWNGATVFWQIDNNNKVRTGKTMLYDKKTGKRVKKPYNHVNWVHSILKIKDFNLETCLFGLHLINNFETNSIAIVESEKTAIIMSIYKPEYLWLSTGQVGCFNYKYLKPIRNYKIIAYPDKKEFQKWQSKAVELNQMGFDITISNFIENLDCIDGTDLADLVLDEINENSNESQYNSNDDRHKENITIIKSNTEILVSRLSEINPELLNLITTFDLVDPNGNPIQIVNP